MSAARNKPYILDRFRGPGVPAAFACLSLFCVTTILGTPSQFERWYSTQGRATLRISNVTGEIKVAAWKKKTLHVRGSLAPSVYVSESLQDDQVEVTVKHRGIPGRADFDVKVPADTSLSLKNNVGKIEIYGMTADVRVDSFEGDVHMVDVHATSIDVKVTGGNIVFDGNLAGDGPFTLQSVKGDIDVTLPATTPFTLNARSMSETIYLGPFLNNLTDSTMQPRGITGSHLSGGPRLNLTTYNGRINLRKK